LTNWIGTYVLPAAPPPALDARLTERFAVLHAARPVAAEDFEVGVVAGVLAAAVPLPLVLPLGLVEGMDEADDEADGPPPDDAQPAASVAAATRVTPPSPIWKRFVIIPIPFVLAPVRCAQTWDRPQVLSSATQCSVQPVIY
jgi:hypothetical protein